MGPETFREWLIRLVDLYLALTIGSLVVSIRAFSKPLTALFLLRYRIDLKSGNLLV